MTTFGWASSIREVLKGIATLDDSEGPVELICLWFDDLYVPGMSKDVPESGREDSEVDRSFESCFSPTELEALSSFHSFYAARVDELSDDPGTWRDDPAWQQVSAAAASALDTLEPAWRSDRERPVL